MCEQQHQHDPPQYRNRLECHYLRLRTVHSEKCPKCESQYVYFFGEGSEQLEERLRKEFPKARIARLDRDTTRSKRQFQETLGAFAEGALDILVGTQCSLRATTSIAYTGWRRRRR
jgi:primosomal protein N' (replication factor Y)